MKRKNFISLSLAFIFLFLSTTGILMYLKQKAHPVEMAHTIFGLLLVGFAIFHITNNWGSLKLYSKDKVTRSWKKELMFAGLGAITILVLAVSGVLEPVAEFGRIFAPKRQNIPSVNFQVKSTLDSIEGNSATLILQRSKEGMFTPIKVELADSTGKTVAVLYEDRKPTEEEIKERRPLANAFVDTKISLAAPYRIVVSMDKSKQETQIAAGSSGIIVLQKDAQSPLERAFIELK
ncbi:MAG: DUF4405 domain-containing protein [Chitinophagaceae bacterium]